MGVIKINVVILNNFYLNLILSNRIPANVSPSLSLNTGASPSWIYASPKLYFLISFSFLIHYRQRKKCRYYQKKKWILHVFSWQLLYIDRPYFSKYGLSTYFLLILVLNGKDRCQIKAVTGLLWKPGWNLRRLMLRNGRGRHQKAIKAR